MKNETYIFKIADEDWEFQEIDKLNYETFVEEIPQHDTNQSKELKDKFDEENRYIIALAEKRVVGMLAVRDRRPFSLDQKLPDLDKYLPKSSKIFEIRLLAVRKEYRNSHIFKGIITQTRAYARQKSYDLAVISGYLSRVKLYKGLGFVPFGPIVGKGDAQFQPMYLTDTRFDSTTIANASLSLDFTDDTKLNFMPGPVKIATSVRQALLRLPVSHRSEEFLRTFIDAKKRICDLMNCKSVEIMAGSGTLANDVVAAQIAQLDCKGLIITNGEFGERLTKNAAGAGLQFDTIRLEWGEKFHLDDIENALKNNPNICWLWLTQCETSTGMLNDVESIKTICKKYHVKLNLDCISSVGTNQINLDGVYLASITSGKALASFSGLAMVCYNHTPEPPTKPLPRYFDLHYYNQCDGIPYTLPTNLIFALQQALVNLNIDSRLEQIDKLSEKLRSELRSLNLKILLDDSISAKAVTTVVLPTEINSQKLGFALEKQDILISFNSSYLVKRNWIQFCLMGSINEKMINQLIPEFSRIFIEQRNALSS